MQVLPHGRSKGLFRLSKYLETSPVESQNNTTQKPKKKDKKQRRGRAERDHLDNFFAQHPAFPYRRNAPSVQEFYRMCDYFNWDRDDFDRQNAHDEFKTALVHQFNSIYGTDVNDVESWRKLCLALDIVPLPNGLEQSRKVSSSDRSFERQAVIVVLTKEKRGKTVQEVHVNLVDLVDTRKTGESVRIFDTLDGLRAYTIQEGKYFPKESAYAGGVLKFLLREILNNYGGSGTRRRRR